MNEAVNVNEGVAHPDADVPIRSKEVSRVVLVICISFGLFLALILSEVALRLIGFSFRLYPERINFGFKTIQSKYVNDSQRMWTQTDYFEKVERGLRQRPDVLFMGDSCTEFGRYDRALSRLLRKDIGRNPNLLNMGVAGWSSFQGRQQMKLDVARIRPKIVTIYFGWNDHWIGFGLEDEEVAKLNTPFLSFLQNIRFVQLGLRSYMSLLRPTKEDPKIRVPLASFKVNLQKMVADAKSSGSTPVLITAATSQRLGREPAYLKGQFITHLEDLVPLHTSYVEAVREVALSEDVPLCDMVKMFDQIPLDVLERRLFQVSGIHLTPEGTQKQGEFLYECLKSQGLLTKLSS